MIIQKKLFFILAPLALLIASTSGAADISTGSAAESARKNCLSKSGRSTVRSANLFVNRPLSFNQNGNRWALGFIEYSKSAIGIRVCNNTLEFGKQLPIPSFSSFQCRSPMTRYFLVSESDHKNLQDIFLETLLDIKQKAEVLVAKQNSYFSSFSFSSHILSVRYPATRESGGQVIVLNVDLKQQPDFLIQLDEVIEKIQKTEDLFNAELMREPIYADGLKETLTQALLVALSSGEFESLNYNELGRYTCRVSQAQ